MIDITFNEEVNLNFYHENEVWPPKMREKYVLITSAHIQDLQLCMFFSLSTARAAHEKVNEWKIKK